VVAGQSNVTGSVAIADNAEQASTSSGHAQTQTSDEGPYDGGAQQLSLLDEQAGPVVASATVLPIVVPNTGPAARVATSPKFALDAPMRLDPAVRAALAAAISSMNANRHGVASDVGACTVPAGVFVPLHEFERRGVEPPTAVRLLAELSMLAGSGVEQAASGVARRSSTDTSTTGHTGTNSGKTVVRDIGGTEVIGVIVRPRFIAGLDPGYFTSDTPC
jgi:conjugal transfer pilus assembly protein TraI